MAYFIGNLFMRLWEVQNLLCGPADWRPRAADAALIGMDAAPVLRQ